MVYLYQYFDDVFDLKFWYARHSHSRHRHPCRTSLRCSRCFDGLVLFSLGSSRDTRMTHGVSVFVKPRFFRPCHFRGWKNPPWRRCLILSAAFRNHFLLCGFTFLVAENRRPGGWGELMGDDLKEFWRQMGFVERLQGHPFGVGLSSSVWMTLKPKKIIALLGVTKHKFRGTILLMAGYGRLDLQGEVLVSFFWGWLFYPPGNDHISHLAKRKVMFKSVSW